MGILSSASAMPPGQALSRLHWRPPKLRGIPAHFLRKISRSSSSFDRSVVASSFVATTILWLLDLTYSLKARQLTLNNLERFDWDQAPPSSHSYRSSGPVTGYAPRAAGIEFQAPLPRWAPSINPGRSATTNVRPSFRAVSARAAIGVDHAKIRLQRRKWIIRNLGSSRRDHGKSE